MTHKTSKSSQIEKADIVRASRRALITANTDYFALSEEKQELFRMTKNELAEQKIRRSLLNSLLKIDCDINDADDIWEKQALSDVNMLNWALLLTEGFGENYIYLNESQAEGVSLLDFTTLYDYDYNEYEFQQQAKKEEFQNYQPVSYYPFIYPPWIRLLINDVFFYGNLTSVATHIQDEMEEFGSDYIDQLIPNDLVETNDHGKQVKGGFLWDMETDAAGLEAQLDELNDRWHSYLKQCWLENSQAQSNLESSVYILNDDSDGAPSHTFVLNNEHALKKIRWRHFLFDCEALTADNKALEHLVKEQIDNAKSFLDKNFHDVTHNFNPKVVKLRKKTKIIMAPSFLDDLDNMNDD